MTHTITIRNGAVRGMRALIEAVGHDANSGTRQRLILNLLSAMRGGGVLNALRTYIAPSEVGQSWLFGTQRVIGANEVGGGVVLGSIRIVADSLDTAYSDLNEVAYKAYLADLYRCGVRVFVIDDAHRYTLPLLRRMIDPVQDMTGTAVILSTGIQQVAFGYRASQVLGVGLELQLYRYGEDVGLVERWLNDFGCASAALECYRPSRDVPLTSAKDVATMAAAIAASDTPNYAVYAQDRLSNLLTAKAQWQALHAAWLTA